jgi:hypothetical protein
MVPTRDLEIVEATHEPPPFRLQTFVAGATKDWWPGMTEDLPL